MALNIQNALNLNKYMLPIRVVGSMDRYMLPIRVVGSMSYYRNIPSMRVTHFSCLCVCVHRDKLWIKNQQMGAFLSVAKGSSEEPIFLEAHYQGTAPGEPPLVLVGKGINSPS